MASIDIRKRAEDQVWRVRWRDNGEPQSEEFADPTEAEIFRALVNAAGQTYPGTAVLYARGLHALAVKREQLARTPVGGIRLVDWCHTYIDTASEASVREKVRYHAMVDNHIAETFGLTLLTQVTGRMIKNWQEALADDTAGPGLSAKTIKNVRCTVLAPALAAAAAPDLDGNPPLIPVNPCLAVKAPRVIDNRPEIWHQAEVNAMLAAAATVDRRAYALLATLAGTAMRWSEAVALTTHAVYPDRGVIEVRRKAIKDVGSQWRIVPAVKTRNGWRAVPAAPAVLALLAAQGAADGALVLTNDRGELWRHEAFFDCQWQKIRDMVKAQGFTRHLTLHGLRHTAATRMAENGVDLYTLSGILGHAPGTTTKLYGGRTGNNDARAAAALATLVTGTAA